MKTRSIVLRLFLPILWLSTLSPAWGDEAWQVAPDSSLTFVAVQAGAPFVGRFSSFESIIVFDPDDLVTSRFEVRIQMNTVNTHYADRDELLRGPEFFDVSRFPQATFTADKFKRRNDGGFVAEGMLKIRDVEVPLLLPFRFATEKRGEVSSGLLTGSVVINRVDFGIGLGEWDDARWVGHEVTVRFKLQLRQTDDLTSRSIGA